MRLRSHIVIASKVAIALTIMTALIAVPASAETKPSIEVYNSGGAEPRNTGKCVFEIKTEKCTFTVANRSSFPIIIKEIELTGNNWEGRYGGPVGPDTTAKCENGKRLASLGYCELEFQLKLDNTTCNTWINGVLVEVYEEGNESNTVTGIGSLIVNAMNPPLEE